MLKVNDYFDGQVKSISFNTASSPASVGVMAPGNYEFGTDKKEIMTVVSGKLTAMLPGETDWKAYPAGATFTVAPNKKFKLKVTEDTAYLCLYVD